MNNSAEIISVGTELLLGDIVNTDAMYLARGLAELGIPCYYQSVVGDNPERLSGALALARSRSALIFLTGGLGPTTDDLTKETAARTMGKTLVLHKESFDRLSALLSGRGIAVTENQKKQAMLPADAVVFRNDYGTAPGFAMTADDGCTMILMPGPPREMEPMFAEQVRPYLEKRSGMTIRSLNIGLFGIGEAAVGDALREKMEHSENPTVAPYCAEGEVRLRVTARGENAAVCDALLQKEAEEILKTPCKDGTHVLGDFVYGVGVSSMEEAAVRLLREKGLTVSFAESCTGGYLAKRITDIPGASEILKGSFVTYSEETKQAFVSVKKETLQTYSVYSEETAREMAEGAKKAAGADIGIGITGVAGPGSAVVSADGKELTFPAGTVFLACAGKHGTVTKVLTLRPGNRNPAECREFVRRRASSHALSMILEAAKEE